MLSTTSIATVIPGKALPIDHNVLAPPGFELISLLGTGGMGEVYLARQCHLDRLVAIKVLNANYANNPVFMHRIRHEALALAAMNHPNIVGCHDIVKTDNGVFLIIEYVPGQLSVKSLLLRFGPLSEPMVVRILLDVVKGLAYTWNKGYTHYDLKPDNLLIYYDEPEPLQKVENLFQDKNTRVKICDFGISKSNHNQVSDSNPSGGILGSPAYIAPEQVFFPAETDFRADIYALAGTAYYMLTQSLPFPITNREQLLAHKLRNDIPEPVIADRHLTPQLRHILRRMGRADSSLRYLSYDELLSDLDDLQELHQRQSRSRQLVFARWREFSKGAVAVVMALLLLGGLFRFGKYVHTKYYQAVQVSLVTSLGFWQGNSNEWSISKDLNENTWVMTGKKAKKWLSLIQIIHPGQNLQFKVRHPTAGNVICQLEFGLDRNAYLIWSRDPDLNSSYSFYVDRKVVTIGELPDKKTIEWLDCTVKLSRRKIILYTDGELASVVHLNKPIDTCRFSVRSINANMMQLKEVYISDLLPRTFNE